MAEPTHPRPLPPEELGFEKIVYEKAPPRATIRLNRPQVLNAFDFQLLRGLEGACEDASWDDEIRVVVLPGTGRAFCVGANLKSWAARKIAIVAAEPIRGAAIVIVRTMKAPVTPPSQSQAGEWKAAA